MLKYLSHKLRTEADTDGNNVQQEKVRTIQFIKLRYSLFKRIYRTENCLNTPSIDAYTEA